MSEMVERAAKRVYEERAALPPKDPALWADATEEAREWLCGHIRAALLAALDLSEVEQQQLFEDDADHDGRVHNESVRATLQKLKAFAQGET